MIERVWKKSYLQSTVIFRAGILEEISMRMRAAHAPKVIEQDIEDTQQCNQKHCRVLCLEADCDHHTCKETKSAHCNTDGTPAVSFEDKSKEQEDKKNSSSELKISSVLGRRVREFREPGKSDFATMK